MNTKAKSNSVITHEQTDSGLIFNVLGVGALTFDPTKAHKHNRVSAEAHGWIQRISDAAAISRNPDTGKPATPQEKFDAMAKLVAHYESGTAEWSRVREAGESTGGLLFRALCKMSPTKSPEQIRDWMKGQSKAQLRVLAMEKRVADVINTFRPLGIDVDTEAMLAEIGIE